MTVPARPETLDWDIGRSVRGYRWIAAAPRALLLLQHGYAEYAHRYLDHYNRLIPHLVAMGVTVHAIDLEGHGGSPGRRGATDVRRAVEDHHAARLAMRSGGERLPVILFGHSLGGLVTAASAARDPDAVDSVVLSSPALLTRSSVPIRVVARNLGRALPNIGLIYPQSPTGLSGIPAEVDAFRADPAIYHGPMRARLAASALDVQRNLWTRAAYWRLPVLAFHGDMDSYADHRGTALFIGMVESCDRHFHCVANGRHELLNDVAKDTTLSFVLDWIIKRIDELIHNHRLKEGNSK